MTSKDDGVPWWLPYLIASIVAIGGVFAFFLLRDARPIPSKPVSNYAQAAPVKASIEPKPAVVAKSSAAQPPPAVAMPKLPIASTPIPSPAPTPPVVVAPPPAPPSPTTFTVNGAAWMTRNDAGSDLLRGLRVYAVRGMVPHASVELALVKAANSYDTVIKMQKGYAADDRSHMGSSIPDIDKMYADSERDHLAKMKEYQDGQLRAKQAIVNLPSRLDFLLAADLAKSLELDNLPNSDLIAVDNILATTNTNSDGKYTLSVTSLDPVYLFARISTKVLCVEWIIPIQPKPGAITVDLFNENATTIRNFRP